MGWQLSPCLVQLRAEINARFPNRSKRSDGTIGDASHSARYSDHNPDVGGWVDAFDCTHDPANGCDIHAIFRKMSQQPDPRIKYLISNRQIWNPSRDRPGVWRPYGGSNPHTQHAHISVLNANRMSTAPWLPQILDTYRPPPPPPPPTPPPPVVVPPQPVVPPTMVGEEGEEMFLEVPGYGVFLISNGVPVGFSSLVEYAEAKKTSTIPVARVPRSVGEPMVQNLLKKLAKAL